MKSLGDQFKDFENDLTLEVRKIAQEAGQKGAEYAQKLVKQRSPVDENRKPKRVGKPRYAKGWRLEKIDVGGSVAKYVIHNVNDPTLTHLLENGHELFIYKHPTGKRTRAFPHIGVSEKDGFEKMQEELEKRLKNL